MSKPSHMPYSLLATITDDFSMDRLLGQGAFGKVYKGEYNGKSIAVKVLNKRPSSEDEFQKEFENLAKLQHQNIVRLIGYCNETEKTYVQFRGEMVLAEETHRALCMEYMCNGSLESYLSDEHKKNDWQTIYAIIKGICLGLKYLHEELEHSVYHLDLKPANVLLDEDFVTKIADFGLSRLFGEGVTTIITKNCVGSFGYLPPEFIDDQIISRKLDIFSLGVVIIDTMTRHKGYSKIDLMSRQQFIEFVHGYWRNRLYATSTLSLEMYSAQVMDCIKIALSCLETNRDNRPTIGNIVNMLNQSEIAAQFPHATRNAPETTTMEQLSLDTSGESDASQAVDSALLIVNPRQLRFLFEPNKLISCPLHIKNKTNGHVAFRISPGTHKNYFLLPRGISGILPRRSSCTYVVTLKGQQQPPVDMDMLDMTLESCHALEDVEVDENFVETHIDERKKVRIMTVVAVGDPARRINSTPTQTGIKIILRGGLSSMDVHPTEPWILASYSNGSVYIWDYKRQVEVMELKIEPRQSNILSTKFIARKEWFVSGDSAGYIHVHTTTAAEEVMKFKAHDSAVRSLAVHPTLPYLLSASDDKLIKLWDWEAGGKCIRIFTEWQGPSHHKSVEQVMFNPLDETTFASISRDGDLKIWSINTNHNLKSHSCFPDEPVCVDYLSSDGQQYIIVGCLQGTAWVWDLKESKKHRRITDLQLNHNCNVAVVRCLDRPNVITVSEDHAISLCNATTYQREKIIDFKLGNVCAISYIHGSIMIGFDDGIGIMEV